MARDYKPNKIKIDLGSYRHYWRGIKKIGKTTLFRDLVLAHYGDLKYGLLISMGNETGYKALDGIYADEARVWSVETLKNDKTIKYKPKSPDEIGFVEIVDDLCKNRYDNEFKILGFDTVDELVSMAITEAFRYHHEKTNKDAKSINEVLGGYNAGRDYVKKIINEQIARLESCGYGLIFVGHTKLRDIKEKGEVEGYQQLTSNLEHGYDALFADKADILTTFYTEKTIEHGVLKGKQRYMYFRDDGFIDCGSRFVDMPDRVEMSAENYLKAFEQGVISSLTKPASTEEIEKMKKEEISQREENAQIQVASENVEQDVFENIATIKKEILELLTEKGGSKNSALLDLVKSIEPSGNPNKIKDIEVAKKLRDTVKSFENDEVQGSEV
jgi:hypothetical protein